MEIMIFRSFCPPSPSLPTKWIAIFFSSPVSVITVGLQTSEFYIIPTHVHTHICSGSLSTIKSALPLRVQAIALAFELMHFIYRLIELHLYSMQSTFWFLWLFHSFEMYMCVLCGCMFFRQNFFPTLLILATVELFYTIDWKQPNTFYNVVAVR